MIKRVDAALPWRPWPGIWKTRAASLPPTENSPASRRFSRHTRTRPRFRFRKT